MSGAPGHAAKVPDGQSAEGAGGEDDRRRQTEGNQAAKDAAGRSGNPAAVTSGNSGGAVGSGR
jgi:hypothetical protein